MERMMLWNDNWPALVLRWVALGVISALVGGVLAGCCAPVRYVAVPTVPSAPATPVLQQCADHAARAQKAAFGEGFTSLQFNRDNLLLTGMDGKVGSQSVGAVYDGDGVWYGRSDGVHDEWRSIRFHCMVSPQGNVVYSFLRAN